MYLDDYDETPWEALKYLVSVKEIFGYNTIIVQIVRNFFKACTNVANTFNT